MYRETERPYGDASQLTAQFLAIAANIVHVGVIGYVVFKLIDKTIGLRTPKADEIKGLDMPETGLTGYSGIVVDKYSETPTVR